MHLFVFWLGQPLSQRLDVHCAPVWQLPPSGCLLAQVPVFLVADSPLHTPALQWLLCVQKSPAAPVPSLWGQLFVVFFGRRPLSRFLVHSSAAAREPPPSCSLVHLLTVVLAAPSPLHTPVLQWLLCVQNSSFTPLPSFGMQRLVFCEGNP